MRIDIQDDACVLDDINLAFRPSVPVRLSPLSANRFRAAGVSRPFDLIFEPPTDGSRSNIRLKHKDGNSDKWLAVDFTNPSDQQLAAYAHDYYCEDLESTYQFFVNDGSLFVRSNSLHQRRLVPTVHDVFIPSTGKWDNIRFVFTRDDVGNVTAFKLHFLRIQLAFNVVHK